MFIVIFESDPLLTNAFLKACLRKRPAGIHVLIELARLCMEEFGVWFSDYLQDFLASPSPSGASALLPPEGDRIQAFLDELVRARNQL